MPMGMGGGIDMSGFAPPQMANGQMNGGMPHMGMPQM
jgi:hypothetical protein